MNPPRIYVQIPAYREPQLVPTLKSLIDQAYDASRLRVRVCWQRSQRDRLPGHCWRKAQVEIDDVDYRESRGANWARRRIQRCWKGEPYSLIVDSHLRFARHWDRTCIELLEDLRASGVRRPLLTCYPPNFDPDIYPSGRSQAPLKIYKEDYIEGLLLHFAGFAIPLWSWLRKPIPAQFLALGFLFTEGRFNAEIPLDPNVYFFGDEITTGLRAYCHGYNFFHPHRVVAWHAYDRSRRTCHWDDHRDWRERDRRSLRRVRAIFEGHSYPKYPLGRRRTIASYERYIGLPLVQESDRHQ